MSRSFGDSTFHGLRYAAFMSVLIVAVLVYGVAKGDPLAFVIAGVLLIFILPLAVVVVLSRRRSRRGPMHNGHDVTLDQTMPVGPDEPEDKS